jgi:AcrR family transcriptional regulator
VREIAAQAQVDPAMVIRYFGSKEGLFRAVVGPAFDTNDLLADGIEVLPEPAPRMLTGTVDSAAWRTGYHPLRLLLCSIGRPTAGPILGEALDTDFVTPLASALKGKRVRERAAVMSAHILGSAMISVALVNRGERTLHRASLKETLISALTAPVASDQTKSTSYPPSIGNRLTFAMRRARGVCEGSFRCPTRCMSDQGAPAP